VPALGYDDAVTTAATIQRPLLDRRYLRLAGGTLAAFVALSALSTEDGPVLCPFRRCTGGYCPGCGMTRSAGRLARGDAAASWEHHPYLLLAVTQLAVVGAAWRLGPASFRHRLATLLVPALMVNLGLVIAIWVVRLLGGSIPAPFLGG
jgi:hypothetical protein